MLSKEQFRRDERAFDKYGDVNIPQNLYIIGTVNMDEYFDNRTVLVGALRNKEQLEVNLKGNYRSVRISGD
ncbi:hypothetical protein N4T77_14835 [Clostridium sp. CX1]|uniref:hypothetical protein n=1 Tax=Clostridium sp. CX1 TaxID=2978346 RepID=UPI0021C027F2|nr:hypothetical protein [Clostridium sp. CX1]MCT8977873.1 hypothetical protein [Clostridium sp. CX1]